MDFYLNFMSILPQFQTKTYSPLETQKLAKALAQEIKESQLFNLPLVFSLEGEIGSGKTTFIQGLAKGFGVKEKIKSPTFLIMQRYRAAGGKNFFHFDFYRVSWEKDLAFVKFKEILKSSQSIVAIEWAKRLRRSLPSERIDITFEVLDLNLRKIKVKSFYAL